MKTLTNITRGYGVSKAVGSSQPRQFLTSDSCKNIWSSRRRFAH